MTTALDMSSTFRCEARRTSDWPVVHITPSPTTIMPTDPTPHRLRHHGRESRADQADQRTDRTIDRADFWGDARTWDDVAPQRHVSHGTGSGGRLGRWWKSAATAGSTANRSHGAPVPDGAGDTGDWHVQEDHAATDVDVWETEPDDAGWDIEPAPVRGAGIDPLIARLGGLIVVATVAASAVMALTSGSDAGGPVAGAPAVATTLVTAESTVGESPAAAAATPPTALPTEDAAASSEPSVTTAPALASAGSQTTTEDEVDAQGEAAALMAAPEPETTAPACASEYELAAGDYWIRIADASGVELADLLAVNDASVDTVLVPGRSICLPAGASAPAPPTTVAPPAVVAPIKSIATATTTAPSRSVPATVAPAPTTTVPARPAAVPTSQAESIIREVWPDELENRALEIAWRESNYQSNVNNYCCYGLFQIHWEAHRSWLSTIGVTSATQLYDPLVNANAAYMLYQRSGGFGPWGG